MHSQSFELPEHLQPDLKKAKKLEWITLAYLLSVVVVMFLVMGQSQAMKTAWLEDALSLLPSIAFLVAVKFYDRPPTKKYPYGYHRVFSIAFLTAAVALFGMGTFLVIDSSMSLIMAERPSIGNMQFFGRQIWMGWIMIIALLYSSIPAMILGFKKLPLAKKLHNKVLYTDADAQKADYMTALAAIVGIIGIGYGLWWADSTAALFISISVLKDGWQQLQTAANDLMDRHPVHTDNGKLDELVNEIQTFVQSWDWVEAAEVRFREQGQVYFGEIQIVAKPGIDITSHIEQGVKDVRGYHWKIHDVAIMPVKQL